MGVLNMNLLNKFFNDKKAPVEALPAPKDNVMGAVHKFKQTHKKKNTFVIRFSPLYDATLFEGCKSTPLAVVKRNGVQVQNETGWLSCTEFPNPCAFHMAAEYKVLAPVMGPASRTITQYLDKETGKPVLMLFPTTDVYIYDGYEDDYLKHLNHASRRDFYHQVNKLSKLIDMALARQMQRN